MQHVTKGSQNKVFIKLLVLLSAIGGVLFSGAVFAAGGTQGIALTSISSNIGNSVGSLASILVDTSLIAGIGFVMASFFKFHQHKLNPTQIPLSQGITLLLIGAGLMVFPTLLPTATRAVFGSQTNVAKIGGSGLCNMIGCDKTSNI